MLDLFLPFYFFIYIFGYFGIFLFNHLKQIHLLTLDNSKEVVNEKIDEKLKAFIPSLYVFFPMLVDGSKTIITDIYQQKDSKLVITEIEKFSETLFQTKTEEEEIKIKRNFVKQLLHLE